MNWKGHVLFGLLLTLAGALLCASLGFSSLWLWVKALPFILLGSILPDIDIENSKSQKLLNLLALIGAIIYSFRNIQQYIEAGWKNSLQLLGLYFLIVYIFKPKHRGITHTTIAALIYGGIVALLVGPYVGCMGVIAYISHLIADGVLK